MKFHSPYQFIPATGRLRSPGGQERDVDLVEWERIAGGDELLPARHDRWQPGCYSGRLVCRLRTKTPVLVGAEQTKGDGENFGLIEQYHRNGRPAIPASSLRGMVASVSEAISQSALRVLDDRRYSVRKAMNQSFEAIGLLRKTAAGGWGILPLAITRLPLRPHSKEVNREDLRKWLKVFGDTCPLAHCLAQYFGDYNNASYSPASLSCFDERNPEYRYRAADEWLKEQTLGSVKEVNEGPLKLRGSIAYRKCVTAVPSSTGDECDRGVLYVLGYRRRELMPNKKHEWFVPFPPTAEKAEYRETLPVDDDIVKEFIDLAKERNDTDHDLPFFPKGYEGRRFDANGRANVLQSGDLVYFDVDSEGKSVTALGFSALWRRRIKGTLFGAFENHSKLKRDSTPWRPDREGLTPAECLFGVVEEMKSSSESPANRPSRNLASRVRFFDAETLDVGAYAIPSELLDEPVALKPQSSPKPPSASMYFRDAKGTPVRKGDLNLESDLPNGRKVYLHQPQAKTAESGHSGPAPPWVTDLLDGWEHWNEEERIAEKGAYSRIGGYAARPVRLGKDFFFHVDFENLSPGELELVRTALAPDDNALGLSPKGEYQHKIGWGKPIGLGSVRIDILALSITDRLRRYSSADALSEGEQGALATYGGDADTWPEELQVRYASEFEALSRESHAPEPPRDTALLDSNALSVLLAVGDPVRVAYPVHYPNTRENAAGGNPTKGYEWFVTNDHPRNPLYQALDVVDPDSENPLPHLYYRHR